MEVRLSECVSGWVGWGWGWVFLVATTDSRRRLGPLSSKFFSSPFFFVSFLSFSSFFVFSFGGCCCGVDVRRRAPAVGGDGVLLDKLRHGGRPQRERRHGRLRTATSTYFWPISHAPRGFPALQLATGYCDPHMLGTPPHRRRVLCLILSLVAHA